MGRPAKIRLGAICTVCLVLKEQRVWKFKNLGGLVKVDAKGLRWKGEVCPQCVSASRESKKVKSTRKPTVVLMGPNRPLLKVVIRKCRECGVKMMDRYFTCRQCENPSAGYMDGM